MEDYILFSSLNLVDLKFHTIFFCPVGVVVHLLSISYISLEPFSCLNSCWTIEGIKGHTCLFSPVVNDLLACQKLYYYILKKLTTIFSLSWSKVRYIPSSIIKSLIDRTPFSNHSLQNIDVLSIFILLLNQIGLARKKCQSKYRSFSITFSYDNKTSLQQVFLNFDYTDKA